MLLSNRTEGQPGTPLAFLGFIVSYGDDIFPNLRISLQILLTIPVSIASCERSFSKLKLIVSYSRASMGQDRLSDLALLSVERETLEKTDFDDVIDKFATVKSRKINLSKSSLTVNERHIMDICYILYSFNSSFNKTFH